MKRNAETLREIGEAFYGPLWQSELARELAVATRTVQRWAAGEFNIPDGVWGELATLARARGQALTALAAELERSVSGQS